MRLQQPESNVASRVEPRSGRALHRRFPGAFVVPMEQFVLFDCRGANMIDNEELETATVLENEPAGQKPKRGFLAPTRAKVASTKAKVIAAAVAVILAGGGAGVAFAVNDHNTRQAAETAYSSELETLNGSSDSSRASAQSDYDGAIASLDEALVAAQVILDGSAGQVADDAVRVALQEAITAATEQRNTPVAFVEDVATVTPGKAIAGDERFPEVGVTVTTGTTPSVGDLDASTTAINTAAEAVSLGQATWTWESLNSAIVNGRDVVLPGSAGKVTDENLRVALQAAIDAALPASGAGAGATPLADTVAQRDAVNAAAQAVVDNQTAWQAAEDARLAAEAEAARVASEQAAAAKAAADKAAANAARPSATTPSRTPSTTSTRAPSTPAAPSGGNAAPAPTTPAAPPASSGGGTAPQLFMLDCSGGGVAPGRTFQSTVSLADARAQCKAWQASLGLS